MRAARVSRSSGRWLSNLLCPTIGAANLLFPEPLSPRQLYPRRGIGGALAGRGKRAELIGGAKGKSPSCVQPAAVIRTLVALSIVIGVLFAAPTGPASNDGYQTWTCQRVTGAMAEPRRESYALVCSPRHPIASPAANPYASSNPSRGSVKVSSTKRRTQDSAGELRERSQSSIALRVADAPQFGNIPYRLRRRAGTTYDFSSPVPTGPISTGGRSRT